MTQLRDHGEARSHPEEGRGLLGDYDENDLGQPPNDDGVALDDVKSKERPGNSRSNSGQRVRFDLAPEIIGARNGSAGRMSMSSSLDDDDRRFSLDMEDPQGDGGGGGDSRHRVPLLTGMEAPSVAVANSLGNPDVDGLEEEMRRPKSGLKSAFMNMANSIIGAGIIGQPYAMRQAGLLSGMVLLVGLTYLVDWTICLIVINSKLSGTSNFQATVEYCFGRPGLISISIAQWAFAFGGMVAFGVIVGDTIPHVLLALWSDIGSVPVLGWLTDRRVAIVVFIMGVSYPLTLYRDISKVRTLPIPLWTDLSRTLDADLGVVCSWPRRARWR